MTRETRITEVTRTFVLLLTTLGMLLGGGIVAAQTTAPAATQPAAGWQPAWFKYKKPDTMDIIESTPTRDQINFYARPRQLDPGEKSYGVSATEPAAPLDVGPVKIVRLAFVDARGELVPTLLCTPKDKPGPFPVVIAVHGLHSNKAQVCGQLAPALAKEGFAVLAPDMPLHGERPGSPRELFERKDWFGAIQLHRQGVTDIRQCIDLAQTRRELDLSRGAILAGYSMGAWLNSVAGPADDRVRAMVLMVGGATEAAPLLRMLPGLAAADPVQALPHFEGRPLLLMNGRFDNTVTPEMANRLAAAARQPMEQRWYESGHRLPDEAYQDAAKWIRATWNSLRPSTD